MLFNLESTGGNLWDNFVGWLDENFGLSTEEDKEKNRERYSNNCREEYNKKMRVKVQEWLLTLPDEVEPLDEDEEDLALTEEELAMYEQLIKKNSEAKSEVNPLKKILQWLDELTTSPEEESAGDENIAALKRCESVEDFLTERFKTRNQTSKEVPENESEQTPAISVSYCEEVFDPYLNESASTRFYNEWSSTEELDEVKSESSSVSNGSRRKKRSKSVPKAQMKKLGKYLTPARTVYRQRAGSDATNDSTEDHIASSKKEKRKDRSFSEGDVYKRKDTRHTIARIKDRLEKRKAPQKKPHGESIEGVSDDQTSKLDERDKNLIKKKIIKLAVTRAKYTLNGY